MNKIIIAISLLAMLMMVGCGSKAVQQCDYKPFLDQNTNLITQNTACQTEKNACNVALVEQKNINNQLKLQMLNNVSNIRYETTSCNTVVRLLNQKEQELEDCWFDSNATVYVTNNTWFNQTLYDLYINCTQRLESINQTLYG